MTISAINSSSKYHRIKPSLSIDQPDMQAVIDGLGIGIAGLPTLSHDLNKKRLQAPFQVQVTGSQYAALVAPDVDKSLSLTLFLEWLEQEALK